MRRMPKPQDTIDRTPKSAAFDLDLPKDGAPRERPSRRFPGQCAMAHPAQRQPAARGHPQQSQRHSTPSPCHRYLEPQPSQPGHRQKEIKEHYIFHIKKYSLFVPTLFPECSHFVPK